MAGMFTLFHQKIAGYGPLQSSDQGDRVLIAVRNTTVWWDLITDILDISPDAKKNSFEGTYKSKYPWTSRLLDRIGPVGQFGEKSGKSLVVVWTIFPLEFPRANFSRQPLRTFHCLYYCGGKSDTGFTGQSSLCGCQLQCSRLASWQRRDWVWQLTICSHNQGLKCTLPLV